MASNSGPFRVIMERSASTICQLASSTRLMEHKCMVHQLERPSVLCLSPFNMIKNCLSKIILEQASVILICPYWPSQSWFPTIMQLAYDIPRIFPPQNNLLTSCQNENHPLISNGSLRLVAWRLSGVDSENKDFRKRLQTFCWQDRGLLQSLHINPPGTPGEIGAIKGTIIPCPVE